MGQLLCELARLGAEDVAGAAQPEDEAQPGGPSGQGGSGRGVAAWERGLLLLPLLPGLVQGYARAVAGQRQALETQRASRAQLARPWARWGEGEAGAGAEAEGEGVGEGVLSSDFLLAALFLRLPLGWLEACLSSLASLDGMVTARPSALGLAEPHHPKVRAEGGAAEGGAAEGAARGRAVAVRTAGRGDRASQLEQGARAACACAAVLEAMLCSGVYRPRQARGSCH